MKYNAFCGKCGELIPTSEESLDNVVIIDSNLLPDDISINRRNSFVPFEVFCPCCGYIFNIWVSKFENMEICSCGNIYFRQCIDGILKKEINHIPGNVRTYLKIANYNYICTKCKKPLWNIELNGE